MSKKNKDGFFEVLLEWTLVITVVGVFGIGFGFYVRHLHGEINVLKGALEQCQNEKPLTN